MRAASAPAFPRVHRAAYSVEVHLTGPRSTPTRSASIRIRTLLVLGLSASMFALASCEAGSGADSASAFTLRDSAGVTIAESTDSAWTEATRWRIADEPDLVIGSVDGSVPGTDFGSSPVPITRPGGLAVLEPQTNDIRIFDSEGRWIRTLARQGDGPAEFRALRLIASVRGDSVAGWDGSARKILTFPLDGGAPRLQPTPPPFDRGLYWELGGWFEDGRYVLGAQDDPRGPAGPDGHHAERLILHSPEGDSLDLFGPFPLWQAITARDQTYRALLGSRAITRLTRGAIWHGFADHGFAVARIDVETHARRVVRRTFERVAAPEGVLETGLRVELESFGVGSPEAEAARRDMWAAQRVVDSLPAYRDFRVSSAGHLWVNHLAHPDDVPTDDQPFFRRYESSAWSVFDPDGRWLGTMEMPTGFQPTEVHADRLLGVRTDDLGVTWIERYPIIRP